MTIFVHFETEPPVEVEVDENFWSETLTHRDQFVRSLHPAGLWFVDGPTHSWLLKQYL